jgi:hypothetical protein
MNDLSLALAHGGALELEDSAADQTVFCLTLPFTFQLS